MTGPSIRVLIVDDSATVRKLLTNALEREPGIEVVGTAPDAFIARDKVLQLHPDVLTLDIEMPGMDGVTFLRKLMRFRPIPVIIVSSLGHASCEAGIEALRAGAVEILCKPNGAYSVGELASVLGRKVRAAAGARMRSVVDEGCVPASLPQQQGGARSSVRDPRPVPNGVSFAAQHRLIAMGASTGGPQALGEVLQALPAETPPILITQHMPPVFTAHFAARMDRLCAIRVKEAEDNDEVVPGQALIAPGDRHMLLRKVGGRLRVQLGSGPHVCFSRPSVDVLFASVAEAAGQDAIGVLLTGMGSDGARGLLRMRERGARTVAQDEESCVVFGMPREAIRLGAAEHTASLQQMAPRLIDLWSEATIARAC